MSTDSPRVVRVRLHIDTHEFVAAMRRVARAAAASRRDIDRLARRIRRHRTHVIESPRGSAMHAAYRAKTKRRNRR